jgi:hypothetical protein
VPKFELYKYNDELFNIYYGIFYELWLSSFRGEDFFLISSPFFLICIIGQNRQKFIKNPLIYVKMLIRPYPRWPPLLKIEISSNGQNCSILSQNVPKFELYKHNDEHFNIY